MDDDLTRQSDYVSSNSNGYAHSSWRDESAMQFPVEQSVAEESESPMETQNPCSGETTGDDDESMADPSQDDEYHCRRAIIEPEYFGQAQQLNLTSVFDAPEKFKLRAINRNHVLSIKASMKAGVQPLPIWVVVCDKETKEPLTSNSYQSLYANGYSYMAIGNLIDNMCF